MMELEICVDSVESAIAAELGGAQRVELCCGLTDGGLTPSLGLLRAVRQHIKIDVYAMIRPRGGDFLYSAKEFSIMLDDIAAVAGEGADGVVLGLLTAKGEVDVERTARLVEAAGEMGVTFHRALDMTRDMDQALEDVISMGATRILTSGGARTALLGSERIAGFVQSARNRIDVMVCGSVRAKNVAQVVAATGAHTFHAALRTTVASPVTYRNPKLHLGDPNIDEYARHIVLERDVRTLRRAMDAAIPETAAAVRS